MNAVRSEPSAPSRRNTETRMAAFVPTLSPRDPVDFVVGLAAVVAMVVPALAVADLDVPGRTGAVLLFVLLVPGVPLIGLLRLANRHIGIVLSVSLSLSVALLTGLAQVTLELWSPTLVTCATAILSLGATAVLLRRTIEARSECATTCTEERVHPSSNPIHPMIRYRMVSTGALALALGLWLAETRTIDLDAVGPAGLIGVLSWKYALALLVVCSVVATAVRRPERPDRVIAAMALGALTVVLYQLVNVADGSPLVGTNFVHVGFIDFIATNHRLPPSVDARFSWSGFFDASAVVVNLAGLRDASALLLWSPAVFTLLTLVPGFFIAKVITGSERLAWLAATIYVLGNWFQQDYFSPQAVAMVLYLSIVATLLWVLDTSHVPGLTGSGLGRVMSAASRVPGRPAGLSAGTFLALETVLLLVASAMVVSHQLTPVLLIVVLSLLTVSGYIRFRTLALLVALVFACWLSYGAPDYWTGHLHVLLGDFGAVTASLDAGIGSRVSGEPTYSQMQLVRIAWTAAIGTLAVCGLFLRRRNRLVVPIALLSAAPFSLVLAQSYGGEIVIRCFVYSLPFLAPLAACALTPLVAQRRRVLCGALALALLAGSLMLTATRGLNTAFERNPADTVAQARALLDGVPVGTTLLPPTGEGVVRMARLGEVVWPPGGQCAVWTLDCVRQFDGDYIFLSTSQQSSLELQWGVPADWLWDFGRRLVDSGSYRLYSETDHVMILVRSDLESR